MTTVGRGGVETTQHWPQRRRGLGDASLTDFLSEQTNDPNFAAAWQEVQNQLVHEQGFDPTELLAAGQTQVNALVAQGQSLAAAQAQAIMSQLQARGGPTINNAISQINTVKIAMVNSYQQLASTNFDVSGPDAIQAAQSLVMAGETVVGAVGMAGSLINTFEHGSPAEVVQTFTGTMIGLAVAAGAVTAGLGAAIVGAVGAVLDILQQFGLFGSSPENHYDFSINTLGVKAYGDAKAQVAPGSNNWRSFPDPTIDADAGWFRTESLSKSICWPPQMPWKGLVFGNCHADGNFRITPAPIEQAFPAYPKVVAGAVDDFGKAYLAAWKANAEYALNGLKPQPDEIVLIHLLKTWNRAHQGPEVLLYPSSSTYIGSLVNSAISSLGADSIVRGNALALNSGPIRTVTLHPSVISLRLRRALATAPAPSGFSNLSAPAKVAVVGASVTGAALVGTAIFAFAKGQAVDAVLGRVWKYLIGKR